MFFTHETNFEEASSRGLGFYSLYCPLCFDYGVYSEMIMNLRMIKNSEINIFNNTTIKSPRCTFVLLKTQFALKKTEMNWLQQDLIFQTTWTINHKHIQQTHYQVVSRDQKTTLSKNVEMLLSVDT